MNVRHRAAMRLKMKPCPKLFSALAWFLGALATPVFARSVAIPSDGIHLDIPDDWTVRDQRGALLLATAPGGSASVSLQSSPNPEQKRVDESFYLDENSKLRQKRAKADNASIINLEAGDIMVGGVPSAYIHSEEPMPDGRTFYSRDYLIAANGKFYALSLDSGDPFTDQKLTDIVKSFRFDSPPLSPDIERPYYHRLKQVLVGFTIIFIMGIAWATLSYLRRRRASR
jgi:hypothetical protein